MKIEGLEIQKVTYKPQTSKATIEGARRGLSVTSQLKSVLRGA